MKENRGKCCFCPIYNEIEIITNFGTVSLPKRNHREVAVAVHTEVIIKNNSKTVWVRGWIIRWELYRGALVTFVASRHLLSSKTNKTPLLSRQNEH